MTSSIRRDNLVPINEFRRVSRSPGCGFDLDAIVRIEKYEVGSLQHFECYLEVGAPQRHVGRNEFIEKSRPAQDRAPLNELQSMIRLCICDGEQRVEQLWIEPTPPFLIVQIFELSAVGSVVRRGQHPTNADREPARRQ